MLLKCGLAAFTSTIPKAKSIGESSGQEFIYYFISRGMW
jgi:hypothetical protein